jgi:hypothetical protein
MRSAHAPEARPTTMWSVAESTRLRVARARSSSADWNECGVGMTWIGAPSSHAAPAATSTSSARWLQTATALTARDRRKIRRATPCALSASWR